MKKIILFVTVLLLTHASFAQLVQFVKANYFVNDNVTVNVVSQGKFFVENDLTSSSQEFGNGGQNISVGTIKHPGFYKLVFHLPGGLTEAYGIWAGNKADDITKISISPLKPIAKTADQKSAFDKFCKIIFSGIKTIDFKKILTSTVTEYAVTHAVAGTVTIVVCASALSVPIITPICLDGVKDQGRDLLIIFLKEINKELHDKKKLTDEEFKTVDNILEGASAILDIISAKSRVDKFISAAASGTKAAIQNAEIKMLIEQEGKLYDQTKILLEVGKKLP